MFITIERLMVVALLIVSIGTSWMLLDLAKKESLAMAAYLKCSATLNSRYYKGARK